MVAKANHTNSFIFENGVAQSKSTDKT